MLFKLVWFILRLSSVVLQRGFPVKKKQNGYTVSITERKLVHSPISFPVAERRETTALGHFRLQSESSEFGEAVTLIWTFLLWHVMKRYR